ncbi:hypothetical protein DW624_RS00610 [Enterococcus hirae]
MKSVLRMSVKGALLMSLVAIALASVDPAYALVYWGTLLAVTAGRKSSKMPVKKEPTSDGRR